jgi:hypothetical protein
MTSVSAPGATIEKLSTQRKELGYKVAAENILCEADVDGSELTNVENSYSWSDRPVGNVYDLAPRVIEQVEELAQGIYNDLERLSETKKAFISIQTSVIFRAGSRYLRVHCDAKLFYRVILSLIFFAGSDSNLNPDE